MPARKFIEEFQFDPATYQHDAFKERLLAEITEDETLSTSKIDTLTSSEKSLRSENVGLKSRLWDATVARQGEPVNPTDSPTAGGGSTGSATDPVIDLFAD